MNLWKTKNYAILFPFLAIYLFLLIQTAWVSDDAYITFRTIENFLHGYGMVFNVGERVQTFTHPLWFLIQAVANFTFNLWKNNPFGQGQMYFLNAFLSIGISIVTVFLFAFKVAKSRQSAILGLLIFSASKSFLDYSTSGLENPLTHLIFVLFVLEYVKNDKSFHAAVILSLLACLSGLNRLDTLLFYLPPLFIFFLRSANKTRAVLAFTLGFTALLIWELFSLFYYGFPFPNTAYAKLNTGISRLDLIAQGIRYGLESINRDPLTLLCIFAGSAFALKYDSKRKSSIAGILLYLLYIILIGGDFMSGRFFSLPLLGCTVLLCSTSLPPKIYTPSFILILILGVMPAIIIKERSPFFYQDKEERQSLIDENGITDERAFYVELRLIECLKNNHTPAMNFSRERWVYHNITPTKIKTMGALGMNAMTMGPDFHVIDHCSLADPLMPRMPLYDTEKWRIGHFRHILPKGYKETLKTGENQIQNDNVALYYEKLSYVIKGDLWDWRRLMEIWNLNSGKYKDLLKGLSDENL